MKVSIEHPLAQVLLRKYEKPYKLSGRELVKKSCLSLGVLQPGDSRDVVVDVFQVVLSSGVGVSSNDVVIRVRELRERAGLPRVGVAASNIKRQLRRLCETQLVERKGKLYRVVEGGKLEQAFVEKVEQFVLKSVTERVKEYLRKLDEEFLHGDIVEGKD